MNRLRQLCFALLAGFGGFAVLAGVVMAQTPGDVMADANLRYERGEFGEAIQQYEALIDLGYKDPTVHYNLGNAHLEGGDLGRAILNYLRAEELSPRDPDIQANLELARSRTVDHLEAEGDSLVASISDFGHRWATTGEFGVAAILLWASRSLGRGRPHSLAGPAPEGHPCAAGRSPALPPGCAALVSAEYAVLLSHTNTLVS